MPHSYGLRRGTRKLFAKKFRKHGLPTLSKTLTNYKVGDFVTLLVDSAIHKGMPYKYYHGRTGRVFTVGPRAYGVVVSKRLKGKTVWKRLYVRPEHMVASRCKEDHLRRVKDAIPKILEAKERGERYVLPKRSPIMPQEAEAIKITDTNFEDIFPEKYVENY
eukprot:Trichotokara_eunicae@DN6005_c0_g1_i2.p1